MVGWAPDWPGQRSGMAGLGAGLAGLGAGWPGRRSHRRTKVLARSATVMRD